MDSSLHTQSTRRATEREFLLQTLPIPRSQEVHKLARPAEFDLLANTLQRIHFVLVKSVEDFLLGSVFRRVRAHHPVAANNERTLRNLALLEALERDGAAVRLSLTTVLSTVLRNTIAGGAREHGTGGTGDIVPHLDGVRDV